MSNIGVVAKVIIKAGKEKEAVEGLRGMVAPTRQEPGCIKYVLHRSMSDPLEYWFVEEWTSREALEKHTQAPHYLAFKERSGEFVASTDVVILAPLPE